MTSKSSGTSGTSSASFEVMMRGLPRLGDHLRRVQQRLRRNAAAVQAPTAEPAVLLNEHNLAPLVRRVECGGVSTRTRAKNDDVDFSHQNSPTLSPNPP